jgi:hypothetical protein
MSSNIQVKRLDNLNKDLNVNLSSDFLKKSNSLLLVIIPQVHLAPYVYALLLKTGYLFNRKIIVVQQLSYKMASDLFAQWPNVIQLEIKFSHGIERTYFQELIRRLFLNSSSINEVVLHNFAESINQYIFEQCLTGIDNRAVTNYPDICFYSDGSRNNATPEMSTQVSTGFHFLAKNEKMNTRLYYFGFIHGNSSEENIEVIPYFYLESTLASLKSFSKIKKEVLTGTENAIVLTRYWGRDPYFFDEKVELLDIFIDSIQSVLPISAPLIIRNDARFNISLDKLLKKLITKGYKVSLFEDLFDIFDVPAKTLLFENFLFDNPTLLSKITTIYCFDSSFPLIFQNKDLYNLLSCNAKIYVGFNKDSVQKYALSDCYSIMRQRTIETIISLCKLSLFNIFDSKGLFFSSCLNQKISYNDVYKKFDQGDGYFVLEKA